MTKMVLNIISFLKFSLLACLSLCLLFDMALAENYDPAGYELEAVAAVAPTPVPTTTEIEIIPTEPAPAPTSLPDLDHILGALTCEFVANVTDCDALAADCQTLNDIRYAACYVSSGGDPVIDIGTPASSPRPYQPCAAEERTGAEICDATCDMIDAVRENCERTAIEDQTLGFPSGTLEEEEPYDPLEQF